MSSFDRRCPISALLKLIPSNMLFLHSDAKLTIFLRMIDILRKVRKIRYVGEASFIREDSENFMIQSIQCTGCEITIPFTVKVPWNVAQN